MHRANGEENGLSIIGASAADRTVALVDMREAAVAITSDAGGRANQLCTPSLTAVDIDVG